MKKIISIILCISLICSMALSVSAADTENVPSSWAEGYVDKANDMNIIDSSNVAFTYKKYIDRESYCDLAFRTLEEAGVIQETYPAGAKDVFTDTQNGKVYTLNKMGIIKGKGNGKFAPYDSLTREEAATILFRMLNYSGYESDGKDLNSSLIKYGDDKVISDWAYDAVYAMLKIGIMNGTGKDFEPKAPYTGEQAVTTMVRILELITSVEPEPVGGSTFADNLNSLMPKDQNYMFSPLSIKMALAMAANGASGETQDQIVKAMGIKSIDVFNTKSKDLISKYSQSDLLKLNVANSIWINSSKTDQKFAADYESKLQKFYNATSGIVNAENAADTINGWVDKNTNGKIPTIIDKNNSDFWAIILNAVYFKGRWADEFSKVATKPDTFTDRDGKESQIDFMNKTAWIQYADVDGVSIIEMPYIRTQEIQDENGEYVGFNSLKGVDVSMFLMASDGKDFNPESTLADAKFNNTYVSLSVPKFKIESSSSISTLLKKLGIEKAFTDKAEFEGMFDKGNMQITDTIHKTYINVDEEGTEAAAVTGIMYAGSAIPPQPIVVKYDKPFTFVIMDKANDEILFMGEYAFAE